MNRCLSISRRTGLVAAALVALIFCHTGPGHAKSVNLAKKYKATLDYEEGAGGRDWTCGTGDVWSLKAFTYTLPGKVKIVLGPSVVVFGKQGGNVLWAVVLPDEPGRIVKAPAGEGDEVTSIFLRFHPARVGAHFPTKTVKGQGAPFRLVPARWIYQHKINAAWQHDNLPVIPYKEAVVLDCETTAGTRRFFSINEKKKSAEYVSAFQGRAVPEPPSTPLRRGEAADLFEKVWKAFDREYAMFTVKPSLDWKKLKKEYAPLARKAGTGFEAAAVIAALLAHLEDLHVHVTVEGHHLWCFSRFRPLNASWKATKKIVGTIREKGKLLAWGKTKNNFGYISVWGLNDPALPDAFDSTLEELKNTKGLILDLRFNGGGSETLALKMAGRFVDKKRIYSLNQYRNGPKHKQLGSKLERTFEPCGAWRYEAPVAVLCGRKTMSSAESFVLMMAQCPQVVLIGDRTAGSSANPRRLELDGGIVVNLPRWLDMDPDGKPIDAVGVAPDILVEAASKEFSETEDPVLEKAIKQLKK